MKFEGFGGGYQGSSFSELLHVDYPQYRLDWGGFAREGRDALSVPHGTTVLAFKYAEGVLVAGDRLATEGMRVASRDIQKVYATDAYSMMAIAGAAGPAIEMARIMRVELEHYEKIEGEGLEIDGKANKLSQMIRANLPAAMQGLVVVPLFAGYDLRRRQGRLWKFDVTGGRYEEAEFEATGSGGVYARESLKKSHRAGAGRPEAVEIAIQALTDAADEDRGTGGIDTLRRIFPTVIVCSERGIEQVREDELRSTYENVLRSRAERGGA
ncbi:MAG: proteasome subunit beta [Myxococcales bacterium]|nr:proteasome subunit beta [Myxococcales bacterium]MDH5306427.1 proteasome subunit beta [Myxococcales bacterium]